MNNKTECVHIKELAGHSGCALNLYKSDSGFYVRKGSSDISYNSRLKKQYIKQKKFYLEHIKTPQVLRCGEVDGLFYFEMEFIQATTLADIFKNIKVNEIENLGTLLFKSLQIENQSYSDKSNSIFQSKIIELRAKLKQTSAIVADSFKKLEEFNFAKIPQSPCHGDLTLENILLDSNKDLYLIDFLDSFYNSWIVDVAKLLQDLELGWTYRYHSKNFNLNLRLNTAKGILLTHISSMPKGAEHIISIYHVLLLNLLRIIPYAKDDVTKLFLEDALEKNLKIIYEMEAE